MPVREASLHPPPLDGDGDGDAQDQIPWVLLEETTYVADRRNATTAYTHTTSGSGAQIQVTLCFARPPRVSYVCVYLHGHAEDEVIAYDPAVHSTDANLVLLGIAIGPLPDFYIYRPAGDGDEGPSLTRLEQPPCDLSCFYSNQVGVLSWHSIRRDDDNGRDGSSGLPLGARRAREKETPYMVAVLSYAPGRGPGHQLYVYDSKQRCWTTHTVAVDAQYSQKYGVQQRHILHENCKVIPIGGKRGTMGFVDLWRGIMLCDLLQLRDNPRLEYIKLPPPLLPDGFSEEYDQGEARLYRDIAVVGDRIVYVENDFHLLKPDPTFWDQNRCFQAGWVAATWSRLLTSPMDSPWEKRYEIDSSDMDITIPEFNLLPKMHDEQGKCFPPFKKLSTHHPTISLQHTAADATVCFMVKKDLNDGKAWVIAVDMASNKLEAVSEFDVERSARLGFVYMHSGISKYVKRRASPSSKGGNLKRPGGVLSPLMASSSSNKKHHPGPRILKPRLSGAAEEKEQDLEMEDMMAEDGDDNMLLDL